MTCQSVGRLGEACVWACGTGCTFLQRECSKGVRSWFNTAESGKLTVAKHHLEMSPANGSSGGFSAGVDFATA